ncbi:MAG: hypothetical protein IKF82_01320 [Bacilli bacterium]|nr:hypothetical protein [Bacilli bacterium]
MEKIKVPTKDGKYDIHYKETGEFAPKDGGDDSPSFDFDVSFFSDISFDDDLDILDDSDLGSADSGSKYVYDLTSEQKELIDSLGFGDVELSLINEFDDFDEEMILNASEDELKKLLQARLLLDNFDKAVESDKDLQKLKEEKFTGLWKDAKDASDYEELSTTKSSGADFTRFEAKRNYIENSTSPDKEERLENLDKLKALGEQYIERKNKLFENYSDLKDFVNSYRNSLSPYSKERKDVAKLISDPKEALEKFSKSKDIVNDLKENDYQAYDSIGFYTGSFSVINEPLRGTHYWKSDPSPYGFVDTVEAMTRAIDKSTFDFDYTVERGTGHISLPGGIKLGNEMSESELKSYIGAEFKQQSFCSTSAVENARIDKDCLLHIYCPKGTKGFFAYDVARYDKKQYEVILQRGYSYKITNITKKGGKVHIDCDVVLGSDKEKYDSKKLKEIEREYVG